MTMNRDQIRAIFQAHGFTVKEGQTDLKPYVYEAAEALLKANAFLTQPAQPVLDADDLCTVVGVKKDGTEDVLGQGPRQPKSKARDILRSYGFDELDNEDTDSFYALLACEELVQWMVKIGWQAPPLVTIPAAPNTGAAA